MIPAEGLAALAVTAVVAITLLCFLAFFASACLWIAVRLLMEIVNALRTGSWD